MKKTLILLFVACMITVSFGGCDHTPKVPDDGTTEITPTPSSDFEYEINSAQTGILINKYIGTTKHVVIPSEINGLPVLSLKGVSNKNYPTTIDNGVFEGSTVETIVIPEAVQVIGYKAFKDCKELTKVTILANSQLTRIEGSSFENCSKFEKMDLSATQVKIIGTGAFRGCNNMKEIVFSNKLEEIHEQAFYGCSSLAEVHLPQNLTTMKGGAFAYCTSLKRVIIPPKLSLNFFEEAAFCHVPALEQIVFEEGREEIAGYALFQTDVSLEITVPKSVKKFSPLTFLITPSADIAIIFLGDAPEIVDDDTDWFGNPTLYYDPETVGWESFSWNEKFEIKPIQEH